MVKVAGLMAIKDFPMADDIILDFVSYCDLISVRFDAQGDRALHQECKALLKSSSIPFTGLRGRDRWNRWNWREQLIRSLDAVKPDYVLFLDSDEAYDFEFASDFQSFVESGRDLMMFDYVMDTDDGRTVKKYPGARHCKAYKWIPNIRYSPYKGYAKPTWPVDKCHAYNADTPIHHFCFYTEAMEREKMNNLHK